MMDGYPKPKAYWKWQLAAGYNISRDKLRSWLEILQHEGKIKQSELAAQRLSPLTVHVIFREFGPPEVQSVFESKNI